MKRSQLSIHLSGLPTKNFQAIAASPNTTGWRVLPLPTKASSVALSGAPVTGSLNTDRSLFTALPPKKPSLGAAQ